jgi:chromosome partitioning protein
MKIAITSLKGGVGKTTISTNLAVCFAQRGYKVCIVDTDAEQESSISWSEQRQDNLVSVTVIRLGEKTLIREVKLMEKNYDIILLDGSPQLKELASATIAASDFVIIPISPSAYDFWALENFLARFEQVRQMKEDKLEAYILLNKFNENQNIGKELNESLKTEFADIHKLKTTIGERVAYKETISLGIGVTEYKDKKAKEEIEQLVQEIEVIIKNYKN